ncbi:MAG: hypothetical protein COB08_010090 [Rhodobacteraceae bacterium]|nr:hypothetical protein [Paracoccaceae bacterium]
MQSQGLNYKQIANQIGIEPCAASALISSAKRKRQPVELQSTICVDIDVLDALRPAAIARGISVNKLCRNMLSCIANDDIADAILDDALKELGK